MNASPGWSRLLLLAVASLAAVATTGHAATSGTVVSATVPSAISIDASGCPSGAASVTDFGSVLPSSNVVTGGDCTVVWGSSNDTSMLRLAQVDGDGEAMQGGATTGLIGSWPLPGTGVDVSSTANAMALGVAAAQPTVVAGPPGHGQALQFDGGDTAYAPDNAVYSASMFTLDLWFRTSNVSNTSWPTLAARMNGGNRPFILYIEAATGHLGISATTGGSAYDALSTGASVVDGAWHHAAVTFDPARVERLYLDGQQVASQTLPGAIDTATSPFQIAGYGAASNFSPLIGAIDDVRFQVGARTPQEIRSYATGRVKDYGAGGTWAAAPAFGACLRSATTATAVWTPAPGAACTAVDGASWNAVPTTTASPASKVASAATSATGTARLRFGFAASGAQAPGNYTAPVVFEALAPDA